MTSTPGITAEDVDGQGSLDLELRFSIVPEWVLDADISDAALRLYAVLLRYGQTSGQRMPSRALLAQRLRKKSKDTVDRALKELVSVGAVVVQRRRNGAVNLTNRYLVMSSPPGRRAGAREIGVPDQGGPSSAKGGRTDAATPQRQRRGRNSAATPGRTDAATLAAGMRPDPEVPTQTTPPPPSPSPAAGATPAAEAVAGGTIDVQALCAALGIEDLGDLAEACRDARRRIGRPSARWTTRSLAEVLHEAVIERDWPATAAVPALLALAADPATQSPARLPCPGPWWDVAERPAAAATAGADERAELAELEAVLAEAGGERVRVQRLAREQLAAEGAPVNRLSVARRAHALLESCGGAR